MSVSPARNAECSHALFKGASYTCFLKHPAQALTSTNQPASVYTYSLATINRRFYVPSFVTNCPNMKATSF